MSHRVQIVFDPISCERLHYHAGAIALHCLPDVSCRPDGITHVMQAVKESHEIVIFSWKVLEPPRW